MTRLSNKCDLQHPSCGQCLKARIRCPGPLKDADLPPAAPASSVRRKKPSGLKIDTSATATKSSIVESPTIPLHERASCHFVANYCLTPHPGGMRGFLDFLMPLLKSRKDLPHIRLAFDACSIASLNNSIDHKPEYESLALAHYTKALAATSAALRNPAIAKDDATLAAVYLLCLFETITATSVCTIAWGSHTRGALVLIRARGYEQLQSKSGLDLFITSRTQIVSKRASFLFFIFLSFACSTGFPFPLHP